MLISCSSFSLYVVFHWLFGKDRVEQMVHLLRRMSSSFLRCARRLSSYRRSEATRTHTSYNIVRIIRRFCGQSLPETGSVFGGNTHPAQALDVKLKKKEKALYVTWEDQVTTRYPAEYLRVYSPSADVRSLVHSPPPSPQQRPRFLHLSSSLPPATIQQTTTTAVVSNSSSSYSSFLFSTCVPCIHLSDSSPQRTETASAGSQTRWDSRYCSTGSLRASIHV